VNSMKQETSWILVVDDEPIIREVLSDFFTSLGYHVRTAENGAEALQELMRNRYNLVMTDLKMPVMGGAELLAAIAERKIKVTVIVMTAYATVETAIKTMKDGAYDYIMKPFKIGEVTLVVQRALEKERLERENLQLKETNRLYQISQAMDSSLSLDQVLPIIVLAARSETDAEVVSLVLRNDGDKGWSTKICDTDIPDVLNGELDDCLDLDALGKAHGAGLAVLHPPGEFSLFERRSLDLGRGLVSFVSVPLAIQGKVSGMLNVFSFTPGRLFQEGQRKSLRVLASRAASAVERARLHGELKSVFLQTIEAFAFAIDAKDPYTHGHSRRVTQYCGWTATVLGLEQSEVERIRHAATLHDVGKIGLRLESLNKPGPLTEEEVRIFRTHPQKGCKILAPIGFFQNLMPIIYHHHEHYDGQGYPEGMSGEEIPLGARVLAVADAYDAMTSDRSYRKAMTEEKAANELKEFAGRQFDPQVVDAFLQVIRRKPTEAPLP